MSYPLVQLVSAPSTTATIRLDLNPGKPTMWVRHEGFSLGAPTLLGDPDAVNVQYGNRTLQIPVSVQGTKAVAMAKQSAIARELLRSNGWIRYQQDATRESVWFRILRPEPASLSFTSVTPTQAPDLWRIDLTVPAEPWAYGALVTQAVQTVNNDPASGTNPCRIILPAILGDAPTPLQVKVNPSNAAAMPGFRWMLSLHAGDTQRLPVLWQYGTGDGWTTGLDTGAAAADATFAGGSHRPITFTITAVQTIRLYGPAPAALAPGRYKVLVRLSRTTTAATFSLRLGQKVGAGYFYGSVNTSAPSYYFDRAASTSAVHAAWVDLGEFTFPKGVDPVDALNGANAIPDVALEVGRISGTGSAQMDCLLLVPIETPDTLLASTLFAYFPIFGIDTGTAYGVWDGDTERFWSVTSTGTAGSAPCEMEGSFPVAIPGASNVLTLLQQVNGAKPFFNEDGVDIISASTDVTVSYYPRWLWIGDG